jgi:hypothetical protein
MRRVLLAIMLLAPAALAQSFQVSLPLQGYYRVGQYMPVQVSGAQGEIRITARGAVPTRVASGGTAPEVIVPLLMTSANATEVSVTVNREVVKAGPLRVLQADDRLVGAFEGNEASAATLFPGEKLITVRVDPAFLNPGLALAWDALDALVLDQRARTVPGDPDDLVANGTIVAVQSAQPPPSDWMWEKRGEYWVIDLPIAGPNSTEIDPENYVPSYGLEPQEPLAVRQLVVLGATLFAVLVIGAALLLRPRTAVVSIVLLSFLAGGFAFLGHQHGGAREVYQAVIRIHSGQRVQVDNWGYMRSWRQTVNAPQRMNAHLYPMLLSEGQIASLQMELKCASNGTPSEMNVTLPPHNTIAWLRRAARGHVPEVELKTPAKTPFSPLLREKYLSPKLTYVGDERYSGDIVLKAK